MRLINPRHNVSVCGQAETGSAQAVEHFLDRAGEHRGHAARRVRRRCGFLRWTYSAFTVWAFAFDPENSDGIALHNQMVSRSVSDSARLSSRPRLHRTRRSSFVEAAYLSWFKHNRV
jgi:hypothetical protein